MSAQWGDIATWAGAVGTVGALLAAVRGLRNEREARRQDEQEASEREHRAQAERISGWIQPGPPSALRVIWLLNRSDEPVYDVVVTLAYPKHDDPPRWPERRILAVLPPGQWIVDGGRTELSGPPTSVVEIGFTDSASTYWIRRSDGELEESKSDAMDHYRVDKFLYSTVEASR